MRKVKPKGEGIVEIRAGETRVESKLNFGNALSPVGSKQRKN
jgi:hypothetical protein